MLTKKILSLQGRNQQLEAEVTTQKKLLDVLKPKADYTNKILKNPGIVAITQIAKDYGMSAQKMNCILHDLRVQYKKSVQWLLYKKYQAKGYVHSETVTITRNNGTSDVKMITKWTQKGRLFLYNLLKENGIIPIIEQEEKEGIV